VIRTGTFFVTIGPQLLQEPEFMGKEMGCARFPMSVTADLRSDEARSYLARVGLPEQTLLVVYRDPASVTVITAANRRKMLVLGSTGADALGLDVETAEVVAVSDIDLSVWHVSQSVESFAGLIEAFTSMYPFDSDPGDPARFEVAAREFQARLSVIDPSAFSEDPGFWNGLLMDIAIGDYGPEE
jgi:hypothetical protein